MENEQPSPPGEEHDAEAPEGTRRLISLQPGPTNTAAQRHVDRAAAVCVDWTACMLSWQNVNTVGWGKKEAT